VSAAISRTRPPVQAPTPAPRASPLNQGSAASLSGPVPEDAVPLGELLRQAVRAVRTGLPDAVWVVAAVAAIKPARCGHSVELVEPDVVRAEAGGLRAYLPDAVVAALRQVGVQAIPVADLAGMTVVVRVTVEFHPRWGLSGRILALGPGIEASLAKRAIEATIARLQREGTFHLQRRLPAPRDVTCVTVVHPPAAAGWADIAGELARWVAAGLLTVRSLPVRFEGPAAAAGIAAAVVRAAASIDGSAPDVVLLVRGGGAAASLGALDDEALARAIAAAPVPVIVGIAHASDAKTIADRVARRSVDTPSKVLGVVREMMVAPARRARADHAAVLAAVAAGVERAMPQLATLERRLTADALRRVVAASERLEGGWGAVREAAEAGRGQLARLDDTLHRLAAGIRERSPLLIGRTAAELAALMDAVRARARGACEGADDGARQLATVCVRASAIVDTAAAGLATLGRTASTAAGTRFDRAAADLDVLARTVRERGQGIAAQVDEGARVLAVIKAAVAETLRAQDAAVARLRDTVEAAVDRRVDAAAAALDRALAVLDGADPARVLRLGYALVTDATGHAVTSVAAAQAAATPLALTFADGTIAVVLSQPQPKPQPETPGDRP